MVVPTFPRLSETFLVTKALGLVERGIDVQVACSSGSDGDWDAFGPDHPVHSLRPRVHVTGLAGRRPADLAGAVRRTVGLVGDPRAVGRHLTANRGSVVGRARALVADAGLVGLAPDLVHFEFGSLAVGRMAVGARLDAAVTVSFRGYDLAYVGLDEPDHYAEVWARADGVHVLGEDLWRRAVRRGAPPDLPHALIPPALDPSGIAPEPARPGTLGTPSAPLRILSIGRLHWKKGHDHALAAVDLLVRRGLAVEHQVVGDGELLEAVAFWRHQRDLDDVVTLLRARPPADVARRLAWADVLLHAATSEGFGNAVVEAQAHGVPVVCTDADGLPENVAHGETGLVVPRRDPAALADALGLLAADGDRRAAMGAAGRRRVEHRFRLDDQLDAWERFYADALARRTRAGGEG
jgi:colanic acid/amylovoran biosynthesis glycosyltransferase